MVEARSVNVKNTTVRVAYQNRYLYRGVVSIDMCYSQGEGLNTSLSRRLYLVLYTVVQLLSSRTVVVQLSTCTLSLYGIKYPMCWTLSMNDI